MKELLVLSGKGGTGKTTLATAFIKLGRIRAYADCDVDAPNLHLVVKPKTPKNEQNYYGMAKGVINPIACTNCGLCMENCRFEAVALREKKYIIDAVACEGCGVCELICPIGAIELKLFKAGDLILYKGEEVFSTAKLKMGSGTSGLLVTEVKNNLKNHAKPVPLAIIDGSPGIGCPVIASISGVDLVLIVAEPSISGISDMKRIIETARKFQTKVVVCINKYDTNIKKTEEIERFCVEEKIKLAGKIPFDTQAVEAINQGKSIVDIDCASGWSTKEIFEFVIKEI